MMAVLVAAAAGIGLLLTRNGFYLHVFLSDDKVTAETIRYGNTFLYVDFSMYIFLGFIFAVRNCVQGIGKSQFVLGAGGGGVGGPHCGQSAAAAAFRRRGGQRGGSGTGVLRIVRGGSFRLDRFRLRAADAICPQYPENGLSLYAHPSCPPGARRTRSPGEIRRTLFSVFFLVFSTDILTVMTK